LAAAGLGAVREATAGMNLPKTILVATDFSECAEQALDYAVALAGVLDAKIHLLNVIVIPAMGIPEVGIAVSSTLIESTARTQQAELDKRAAGHAAAGIETLLRTGDARDVILDAAREIGADLIVMGTHGRRGVRRALIGSIAESVVRTAPCPVLTIREHKA
jgi:nucleotide-binding universal stress UspA family protein